MICILEMESPRTPTSSNKRSAFPTTPVAPKRSRHQESVPDSPAVLRFRNLNEEFAAAARDAVLRAEAVEYYEQQNVLDEQLVPDELDEVELVDCENDLYFSLAYFFGNLVEEEPSPEPDPELENYDD